MKIKNTSDIEAKYELQSCDNTVGSRFTFEPDKGVLAIGEEQTIEITFRPDSLGDFNVKFVWNILVIFL